MGGFIGSHEVISVDNHTFINPNFKYIIPYPTLCSCGLIIYKSGYIVFILGIPH